MKKQEIEREDIHSQPKHTSEAAGQKIGEFLKIERLH